MGVERVRSQSSRRSKPYLMVASPYPKPQVTRQVFDCVLITARPPPSTMSNSSSEDQASSHTKTSLRTQKSLDATPLGRGHRVRKPKRLSSSLSDEDEPEKAPKRPRPAPKRARRVSLVDSTTDERKAPRASSNRTWCHQCHQDRTEETTYECVDCSKSYCEGCMNRRYEQIPTDDEIIDWSCPRCLNYCDCHKCIQTRKAHGTSAPSGMTFANARKGSGEARVRRAREQRRSRAAEPKTSAATPTPSELPIPTADALGGGLYSFADAAQVKQVEYWSAAEIPSPMSSGSPFNDALSVSYDSEYQFSSIATTPSAGDTLLVSSTSSSSVPLPSTPRPSRLSLDHLKPENAFRSHFSPDLPSVSPHELTSEVGSMLHYQYSPTIPHSADWSYGDFTSVKSSQDSDSTLTGYGQGLLLSDTDAGIQWTSSFAFDTVGFMAASSLGDPQPTIGEQEAATISSFLNADMFDA